MISFVVYGTPQGQGSLKAFIPKGWNRPILTSTNKNLKSFRQEFMKAALACADVEEALKERKGVLPIYPRPTAVAIEVTFYFSRPQSAKTREFKTTKFDVDKLARSAFDSLTGTIYDDDAQVCEVHAVKRFGLPERTEVKIEVREEAHVKSQSAKRQSGKLQFDSVAT